MRTPIFLLLLVSASILSSCNKDSNDGPPTPTFDAYAIGNGNNLVSFNLSNPSAATSKAITGLQVNEVILAIDIRPANNELYALGSSNRIYKLNKSTAEATAIPNMPFTPVLYGMAFGMDFDAVADRLRIVSNADQNLRINPETGVSITDVSITPAWATITGIAYTNNFAGATSSKLYDIDPVNDELYWQRSASGGVLEGIGPLGIDVEQNSGFDISGKDNKAYALLSRESITKLYIINLENGTATLLADFPYVATGLALALNL
jgi:hypothetical protein